MFEDDLDRAIVILKNGNKIVAREILEHIVQDDPRNDTAWIWLAGTYPDSSNRIKVLQESLKHNPNSHVTQRWLTAIETEVAKQYNQQRDLPRNKIDHIEHFQENDRESSRTSNNSKETQSRQKRKHFSPYSILAGISGFILLGSVGIFGVSTYRKQATISAVMGRKPISSLPTAAQVPSPTMTLSMTPIVRTPTPTLVPTITSSPTSTLVPTITSSPTSTLIPSMTSMVAATEVFAPLPEVARQARSVALERGFTPERTACGQDPSCQAFLNEKPYMLIVVMDNGLVTISFFDETISYQNYVQDLGVIAPGDKELIKWYAYIIGEIYNPFSTDFMKDAAVVIDRVMKYGSYDWESYYGYKIIGTQSIDKKVILTITPP